MSAISRRLFLGGLGLLSLGMCIPSGSVGDPGNQRTILFVLVQSDSVDFRLIDPSGSVAVVAVDSAMSAISECVAAKSSWIQDHDDSDWDPDVEMRQYGGGTFTLENPVAGSWTVDALAARSFEDSCSVWLHLSSMPWSINQEASLHLRPGEATRWRLEILPPAERDGPWARLEFVRRTTIAEVELTSWNPDLPCGSWRDGTPAYFRVVAARKPVRGGISREDRDASRPVKPCGEEEHALLGILARWMAGPSAGSPPVDPYENIARTAHVLAERVGRRIGKSSAEQVLEQSREVGPELLDLEPPVEVIEVMRPWTAPTRIQFRDRRGVVLILYTPFVLKTYGK